MLCLSTADSSRKGSVPRLPAVSSGLGSWFGHAFPPTGLRDPPPTTSVGVHLTALDRE